jgi:hypothetical protein
VELYLRGLVSTVIIGPTEERKGGLQVLSDAEVQEWFARVPNRGPEYVQCNTDGIFYVHPEANCIDIEYSRKLERLPFFVRYFATIGYEDWDFRGALLWVANWGIGNPQDEGLGYRIIEALNRSAGQQQSFEAAPGHLFRADELVEATGMLMQPMVFGWDAFYRPTWSYGHDQFFLHASHDSFVSVVTLTKDFYDKAFGLLKKLDLNPQPGQEGQVRRFCRTP